MSNVVEFRNYRRRPRTRPPEQIYIVPDISDGGCWAVHLVSASGNQLALINRFFSFDDALAAARAAARYYDAVLVGDDDGGAA